LSKTILEDKYATIFGVGKFSIHRSKQFILAANKIIKSPRIIPGRETISFKPSATIKSKLHIDDIKKS
jgi:nucleoid DNA-binding protein